MVWKRLLLHDYRFLASFKHDRNFIFVRDTPIPGEFAEEVGQG